MQKKIREPLLPEGEGGEGETANEPKDVDKGSTISLPERLEKPEPLTRQQVNQCLMDIDDFQPLKKRVKIEHICPCLQVFQRLCCRPRRPEFRQVLRAVMTEELALTPPKDKAKAAAKAKETGE